MFYYLYEIKNLVNDKIYVGVHKTKNMADGYMGSGKVILCAIKKHGAENFTKTILETFENSEAMFRREKEIVTDEFLARTDTYNLRRGGFGGFDYINNNKLNSEHCSKGAESLKRRCSLDPEFNSAVQQKKSIAQKQQYSTWRKASGCFGDTELGQVVRDRAKLPEAIEKRKATYKEIGHQQGSKNANFGKTWITDGTVSKQIMKSDAIPIGWHKGRTGNFTNTRYKI